MRLQIISIKQKQIECSQGNSEVTVPICNRHSSEGSGIYAPPRAAQSKPTRPQHFQHQQELVLLRASSLG